MATAEKQARIWFYSKNLSFTGSLPSSSQGSASKGRIPDALKHWAVVVDIKSSKNPDQVNKRILYEANNDGGLLIAREVLHGMDEEDEWEQSSGFDREDHGEANFDEDRAKSYCNDFNQLKIPYVAVRENCQRFAKEFISNVLVDSAICFPPSVEEAKSWFDSAASTCSTSLRNIGSGQIVRSMMESSVLKSGMGELDKMFLEAIKNINLNGFGKISILAESPLKEYMADEGKQLALTALGEVKENWINASRGAFTWYNLLQIPAEIIVEKLMKSAKFTDLQAYGGKKLASCFTAAGVGLVGGGPLGMLGSVVFWIAAEISATLIKKLLTVCLGDWFVSKFGESQTLELTKSVFRYFGVIDMMKKYMLSTQSTQKKLA